MHEIENDHVFRGPTESMHFDMRVGHIHNLAEKLEAKGFKTYGTNEYLEVYIPSANEEKNGINFGKLEGLSLRPYYTGLCNNGDLIDPDSIGVSIPELKITISLKLKDFKKTFKPDGLVIKTIQEYKTTMETQRRVMCENLSLAVTLNNT
jgi:hypothetical protein